MSFKEYLKYNIANILLNIISLIFLEVFLLSIGNESKTISNYSYNLDMCFI